MGLFRGKPARGATAMRFANVWAELQPVDQTLLARAGVSESVSADELYVVNDEVRRRLAAELSASRVDDFIQAVTRPGLTSVDSRIAAQAWLSLHVQELSSIIRQAFHEQRSEAEDMVTSVMARSGLNPMARQPVSTSHDERFRDSYIYPQPIGGQVSTPQLQQSVDAAFAADLAASSLSPDEQRSLLARMQYELNDRVGARVEALLPEWQLNEFEQILETRPDAAPTWLQQYLPNYQQIATEEFQRLESDIRASDPRLARPAAAVPVGASGLGSRTSNMANSPDSSDIMEEIHQEVLSLFRAGRDAEAMQRVYSSVKADDSANEANRQAACEGLIAIGLSEVGRRQDALLAIARGIATQPDQDMVEQLHALGSQIERG